MSLLITNDGLILSLAPPKPYSLTIKNLTIGGSLPREKHSSVDIFNVPVIPAFMRPKTKAEGAATFVHAVSGTCGAGGMLAIIGGRGSGKTTLLNAIAGRLQGLPILEGKISFQPATQFGQNAVKDGAPKVSDIIGFFGQNDYFLPHLTVRETLTFSAALRLPKAVDNNTVRQIVNQTIEELGLKECADTVVGGIFRKGISGGERRRLSIGCVLVTMPSVLILDEATTGLDATTSFLLLQTLSDLAKRHSRTITLSDAFVLFDRLMVLSKGDVMYSGRASDSLGWFEEHGCKLKKKTNPLDFLVDVTSVDNRSSDREDESRARVTILVQAWKDREHEKDIPPPLTGPVAHNISRDSQGGDLDEDASNIARPGPIKQTRILLHRSHLNVYRNYEQLAGFLIQSIGIGVFMGLTYFELQGTPAGIQSLKGAAFQLFPGYFYLTQVGIMLPSEFIITTFRSHLHLSTFPYIIADFISNLVPTTLPPTLYSLTHLPVWLRWIKWISTTFYSFRIVATTQFKGGSSHAKGLPVSRSRSVMGTTLYVLSGLILQFHNPGGVKHAVGGGPASRDKESALTGDMDIARAKIDVEVKGPSGAGKSTILQLLSHRKLNAGPGAHFEMTGDILFNGLPATEDVRNSVAFVEQEDDYHLPYPTNKFPFRLRYAPFCGCRRNEQCVFFEKRKIARAEEVLLMLGLKDCADIYVGELLKGISGGEKRRISGSKPVQIITCGADDQRSKRRMCLFLQEFNPILMALWWTSQHRAGFFIANVRMSWSASSKSREVVALSSSLSINLARTSSTAWTTCSSCQGRSCGFSGKRKQAVRIMESQGFPLPSLWFNPADHLLDLVTVDQRPGKTGSPEREWTLSRSGTTSRERGSGRGTPKVGGNHAADRPRESVYSVFPLHFPWSGSAFWGRLIQPPFTGILLLIFYERASPSGGQDRIGVVLQATSAIPFVGLISGIAVLTDNSSCTHIRAPQAIHAPLLFYRNTLMEAPFQLLAVSRHADQCKNLFRVRHNNLGATKPSREHRDYFRGVLHTMGIAVSLVSTTPLDGGISSVDSLQVAAQRLIFINECTGLQFRCSADDIAAGICTALSGEELPQYRKANWDSDRNSDIVENPGMGCIEGAYESGMRLLYPPTLKMTHNAVWFFHPESTTKVPASAAVTSGNDNDVERLDVVGCDELTIHDILVSAAAVVGIIPWDNFEVNAEVAEGLGLLLVPLDVEVFLRSFGQIRDGTLTSRRLITKKKALQFRIETQRRQVTKIQIRVVYTAKCSHAVSSQHDHVTDGQRESWWSAENQLEATCTLQLIFSWPQRGSPFISYIT
ncbi:hypothetical protein B0H19DRAFT_1332610 [Mycena capillaripes]|nr:hypothetical protein B0H19DRAFT_1332610 [Mycena capillaripes]